MSCPCEESEESRSDPSLWDLILLWSPSRERRNVFFRLEVSIGVAGSSCPNRERSWFSPEGAARPGAVAQQCPQAPRQALSDSALLPVHIALLHIWGKNPRGKKEVKRTTAELVPFKKLSKKLPQQQPLAVQWPYWAMWLQVPGHTQVCVRLTYPHLALAARDTPLAVTSDNM